MIARRDFLGGAAMASAASALGHGIASAEAPTGFSKTGLPWALRDSESFEYESKAVGDRMAIGIWSPPKPYLVKPGEAMPPLNIVYVLDGSWALGVAATICSLQYVDLVNPGFAPVLLVGVDYPVGRMNARARDYTMRDSVPAAMQKALSWAPQTTPGGADKFLAFLEEELDPFIRTKYHVADGPAGLLGVSFGGTFSFYAFLKQSRLFDRYWIGSPALFATETDYIAQVESRLKSKLVHPTRMFLSKGSRELNGGNKEYEETGQSFNRLVGVLNRSQADSLTWRSKIYDGYTHTSVLAPAMNDALLYLYGKPAAKF